MVHQDDRNYTRLPVLQDLIDVCKKLNELGVRYVLVGGFAVDIEFLKTSLDADKT